MKQGQSLNWKFSIADVDFIVGLAKAGRTADEICARVAPISRNVSVEEIQSICWQSGVKVRAADQA